jgi:hypothetical protein
MAHPHERFCRLCSAELTLLEATRGEVCCRAPCQQQHLGEQAAARRRAEQAFRKAMTGRAQSFLRQQTDLPPGLTVSLAIVPANTRSTSQLPEARKQAFLEHLGRVVAAEEDARETPSDELTTPYSVPAPLDPPPSAEQDQLLGLSCAVCRGHCCRQGVEHAFQDVSSMRRIRKFLGEPTPAGLLAQYSARLPTESYTDSCVFHTEQGCNLPREMRSDMCNTWICAGQHRWLAELPPEGPLLGYVVATADYQPQAVRRALVGSALSNDHNIGVRNDLHADMPATK